MLYGQPDLASGWPSCQFNVTNNLPKMNRYEVH